MPKKETGCLDVGEDVERSPLTRLDLGVDALVVVGKRSLEAEWKRVR